MARQISRLRIEVGALIFENVSGSPDLRISPVACALCTPEFGPKASFFMFRHGTVEFRLNKGPVGSEAGVAIVRKNDGWDGLRRKASDWTREKNEAETRLSWPCRRIDADGFAGRISRPRARLRTL
jgi:hypothetical protein